MPSDIDRASQSIAEYEHTLVEFLTSWNRAESLLRDLLVQFCDRTPSSYILTAELGALGLEQGLLSIAADRFDGPSADAIRHATKLFGRVREYRNYYVHGIGLIAFDNIKMSAVGVIDTVSSKSRFAVHEESVGITELAFASSQSKELEMLLNILPQLLPELSPPPSEISLTREELPERFPLPDRLTKPRNYLLEHFWRVPWQTPESQSDP